MLSRFRLPVRILLALVLFVLPARAADRDSVTWMEAALISRGCLAWGVCTRVPVTRRLLYSPVWITWS